MRRLLLLACLAGIAVGVQDTFDSQECPNTKKETKHCGWHYLLYAPHIFRSGVEEKVMFMTQNVPFPVTVNLAFFKKNYRDPKPEVLAKTTVTVSKTGVLQELVLKIPPNADFQQGFLTVEGQGSDPLSPGDKWHFKNETSNYRMSGEKKGNSIFIQTDRPLYKPGETIRIRVLSVNPKLEPVKGKVSSLVIENPSGSRMYQWKNEELKNGFASFKFPLSVKPVLGKWKLTAEVEGLKESLEIEVKKYVLPKFQVTVVPPKYIVRGQEKIEGQICAKYSYGKPVIGRLDAKFCLHRGWYYYYRQKDDSNQVRCMTLKNQRVAGCYDFTVLAKDVNLNTGQYYYGNYRFVVEASVTESATGDVQNATKSETTVSRRLVQLGIEGDDNLKPGLPFGIKIKATYPDGSPIEKLIVDAEMRYDGNVKHKEKVEIKNGYGNFNIPQIDFSATNVRFLASYERPRNTLLEFDPEYNRKSESYFSVDPWYSPSHSYLKIKNPQKDLEVGKDASIRVYYTSIDDFPSLKTIHYSLMCRGNVVEYGSLKETLKPGVPIKGSSNSNSSKPERTTPTIRPTTTDAGKILNVTFGKPKNATGPITPPPRRFFPYFVGTAPTRPPFPKNYTINHFNLKLKIRQDMVPSCRLLVYYLRGRETVADNADLTIEKQFANQVSMKFVDEEVRPGATTTLRLKASPGSSFAVAAVDKSIHFLRKGNELTPGKLMSVLDSLDIRPTYVRDDWSRCSPAYRKRRSIYPYSFSRYSDSEKAFADSGLITLTNLEVDVRPCRYRYAGYYLTTIEFAPTTQTSRAMLRGAGVGGSGRGRPGPNSSTKQAKPDSKESQVRTDFRETWLWTEEFVDPVTGEKSMTVKVPDTITSWYASGFAVSSKAGLGVAEPVELRTFKPFFVSLHLPYAVIRGEDVTIPAAVFNYKEKCISVEILLSRSKDFRLVTAPRAVACICGGRTSTVLFRIRPSTLGVVPIKVSVTTLSDNICKPELETEKFFSSEDTVIKKLRIEPEGVEQQNVYNALVCPKEGGKDFKSTFDIRVPENTVEGSIFSEVSVIGDLMGPSLSNIDELLAMPYGCGEQNMLKFAPNIFIVQYLESTSQLTPVIESKAKSYMLTGYQRELTYKHKDGSYSAFGEGRENGSMWLTAFVLKSFAQARPYLDIDPKDLTDSIDWIKSHQDSEGCFPTVGLLHNKLMKGGVKTPVTLTAYVLVSLLEANVTMQEPVIQKALECVTPYIEKVNDSYSLAILAYAMAKAGMKEDLTKALDRLESKAITSEGLKHWGIEEKKEKDEDKDWFWWYQPASSGDIEMTAYALLAHLEAKGKSAVGDLVPIVRWLTQQRNSLGGWSSTQDTVLAMQALARYAAFVYGGELRMSIAVSSKSGFRETFNIDKDNSLILQRAQIEKVPTGVSIKASGKGCSLLQIATKYNVKETKEKPSFDVTVDVSPLSTNSVLKYGKCYSQALRVCAKWLEKGLSNMAIINVRMVSGFTPNQKSLKEALKANRNLKEFEFKDRDLVLYYSKIADECVDLVLDQENVVRKTKAVPVTVYDYYDKEKKATKMYQITEDDCKGSSLPEP